MAVRTGGSRGGSGGVRRDLAVRVRGIEVVQRTLEEAGQGYAKEFRKELRAIGRDVANEAARLSPRRSGDLRDSWKVRVSKDRVSVWTDLPYAPAHEYGGTVRLRRGRMVPREFMTVQIRPTRMAARAVEEDASRIEQRAADAMDRALRSA